MGAYKKVVDDTVIKIAYPKLTVVYFGRFRCDEGGGKQVRTGL